MYLSTYECSTKKYPLDGFVHIAPCEAAVNALKTRKEEIFCSRNEGIIFKALLCGG